MGGAVSAGEDNDELIDNLVEAEYIKTPHLEQIFRAVDRGSYYLDGCRETAYRDLAWKHGNIHLSAPCIYSEVMESLKLGPGMSFLNLGSGTGYLSTMAGLVLGTFGVNHGIELHSEVVDYARIKLEEFQATSAALDKYEFCAPSFVVGNCLQLDSSSPQYDRVYCGASCPSEHENYIKNLVRVGGILVMPLNDHLLQVTRTGELTYDMKNVLPVSFASLVSPNPSEARTFVKLPEKHPLSLQEICRSTIRVILRTNAEAENPSLKNKKKSVPTKRRKNKRRIRKVVIPVFEGGRPITNEGPPIVDSVPVEDETSAPDERNDFERRAQGHKLIKRETDCGTLQDHTTIARNTVSIGLRRLDSDDDGPLASSAIDGENNEIQNFTGDAETGDSISEAKSSKSKAGSSYWDYQLDCGDASKNKKAGCACSYELVSAEEDKNLSNSDDDMVSHASVNNDKRSASLDIIKNISGKNGSRKESQTDSEGSRRGSIAKASDSGRESGSQEDTPCSSLQQERHLSEKFKKETEEKNFSTLSAVKEPCDHEDMDIEENDFETSIVLEKEEHDSVSEQKGAINRPRGSRANKREAEMDESGIKSSYPRVGNNDSGIDNVSDDSVPDENVSEPDRYFRPRADFDVSPFRSANFSGSAGHACHRKRLSSNQIDSFPHYVYVPTQSSESPRHAPNCCGKAVIFKRSVIYSDADSDVDSDDLDEFVCDSGKESFSKEYEASREKSDLSCYTYHMKQKINQLPLPTFLKMYLNYSKPM